MKLINYYLETNSPKGIKLILVSTFIVREKCLKESDSLVERHNLRNAKERCLDIPVNQFHASP